MKTATFVALERENTGVISQFKSPHLVYCRGLLHIRNRNAPAVVMPIAPRFSRGRSA
jgi:hypothetical protein